MLKGRQFLLLSVLEDHLFTICPNMSIIQAQSPQLKAFLATDRPGLSVRTGRSEDSNTVPASDRLYSGGPACLRLLAHMTRTGIDIDIH